MTDVVKSESGSARVLASAPEDPVDKTRAWTGLWVVIGGDIAITAGTLADLFHASGSASATTMVAVLSGAFTTIGTMTTAYFGIRAVSNTAQKSMNR